MFFPLLSNLNNEIRQQTSSNDMLSRAQQGKPTFLKALKNSSYILIQGILCGFISTNPLLRFYISVMPTSERSLTAVKTAARGVTCIMVIDIHVHCMSFVCKQEKQGMCSFPIAP